MLDRYCRNMGVYSEEDQKIFSEIRVLIVGCGGLGGFVLEGFARMGVLNIGLCEFDTIDPSNLNRQIISREDNIGEPKLTEAIKRIKSINSDVKITPYNKRYPDQSINLSDYDIVIDCSDNFATKKRLEKDCTDFNIPLIYGAIAGEYGYLAAIDEDNKVLKFQEESSVYKELGNPYTIVAIVGSLQVNLAIRVILGRPYLKRGFYCIDIRDFSIFKVNME